MNKQGDTIPVDPEEKQNETKTWIKKDGFKTGIWLNIRLLDWKIVETYQGNYHKLNSDQLLDIMHHTQN